MQFLLVHPGGPFWAKKDIGAWGIPKGEFDETEDALIAARREFEEETGIAIDGEFLELQPVKLKGGKTVYAYALESNPDVSNAVSNTFEIEWPPHSGRQQSFPEVDQYGWFTFEEALQKINPSQLPLLEELRLINGNSGR